MRYLQKTSFSLLLNLLFQVSADPICVFANSSVCFQIEKKKLFIAKIASVSK